MIRIDQAQSTPRQRWTQYVATQPLQTRTIRRLYPRGRMQRKTPRRKTQPPAALPGARIREQTTHPTTRTRTSGQLTLNRRRKQRRQQWRLLGQGIRLGRIQNTALLQ